MCISTSVFSVLEYCILFWARSRAGSDSYLPLVLVPKQNETLGEAIHTIFMTHEERMGESLGTLDLQALLKSLFVIYFF